MNEKRVRQVFDVAIPYLMQGERIQLATIASVGSVSLARKRPGKKPLMRLEKQHLAASEPKRGLLTLSAQLSIVGQPNGLKITFPRPCREDGQHLLAGLRSF